ncbi:nuclear GTPase SLIP-GC-like [Alligator mississippiensis]|uniref:nuclear GTPase SLIP-GC-like n=1 Tax=Alligator mississippiensis TaxID=8496 RepID=UPI002877D760|nr:nuclear GTPase SLIP-GC-like [Alligator mississippiensis]
MTSDVCGTHLTVLFLFHPFRERWVNDNSLDSEHDAVLERNENVKLERRKKIMRKLKKELPSDSEILDKEDLVYTVSAREYRQEEKLTKEETAPGKPHLESCGQFWAPLLQKGCGQVGESPAEGFEQGVGLDVSS